MSHVDEGALHAYLDGALDEYPSAEADRIRAHLDACAECVERLEVERRVRSDAHDLLGLAVPDVDVPSFEELRAYVQRTQRQRKGLGRLRRLGWAASIVVALGAGWMLREGQLQSRALDIGRQEVPAPAAEPVREILDADGGEAARMGGPRLEADVLESRRPDVSRQADVGRAGTVEPEREGAEGVGARSRGLPADQARDAADLAARAEEVGASVDRGTPPAETVDVVAALPVEPDAEAALQVPTEAVGVATDVLADADEALAGAGEVGQEAPEARTDDTATAGAAWRGQVARKVVPPVPADVVRPVTSALGVTRREAFGHTQETLPSDSVPSEPLLAVPGYEVLSVVNLGDGTTPWGVRVRQRTDAGRVFEVFHLEEGVDPSILPDEGDGAGEVRAETAVGRVLIRGPLSERELAELLGSLFPGAS